MASYHTSFTYNGKNSFNEGYIITAFEPDSGFMNSFLSMENVSDEYYDRSKRFDYGAKYTSSSEIQITMIKHDGSDMSLSEFRSCAKWLTGARINSWLDMYIGDENVYSFLGKFINLEHYKLDSRTIGVKLTFSSISPWAYSAPQYFDCNVGQSITIDDDGVLTTVDEETSKFGVTAQGVLYANSIDKNSYFNIDEDGTIYVDTSYSTNIYNESDDLYTYIYLDIEYTNISGDSFSVVNKTLNEETIVKGIESNEVVSLSAKQFIISSIPNKIFGDNFNFIWPRLGPDVNEFAIYGSGKGRAKFSYRYPMKVGDCVIDTGIFGNLDCGCTSGSTGSGGNGGSGSGPGNNSGSGSTCTVDSEKLYDMLNNILK